MKKTTNSFLQKEVQFGKRFPDQAKEAVYTEFASLLESGVDIQRALTIVIEEQEKTVVQTCLTEVLELVIKGKSLSEACATVGFFSPYEYHSLRIGEETGRLQEVLKQLAHFFADKVKLKRQLISVFTYPLFVTLVTFGVLTFMLNSVVPMFKDVFAQFGQELPFLTQKIIWLSEHFFAFAGFFLLILLVGCVYGYTQRKEIWFRETSSSVVMRIPVVGVLLQKIYLARFCQSMSLLLSSRTPLVTSLELVREMIGFYPLEKVAEQAKRGVMSGESLHGTLQHATVLDKRFHSMVKIAEEINQLDTAFERLTEKYQADIEFRTKLIGTVIEPLIIILIGLIVGVIMVAMYLPMFNLSNVIK